MKILWLQFAEKLVIDYDFMQVLVIIHFSLISYYLSRILLFGIILIFTCHVRLKHSHKCKYFLLILFFFLWHSFLCVMWQFNKPPLKRGKVGRHFLMRETSKGYSCCIKWCLSYYVHRGAPWEFNLRDVFRWCELLSAARLTAKPGNFVDLVYLSRMRSAEDRRRIKAVYQEVWRYLVVGEKKRPRCISFTMYYHGCVLRRAFFCIYIL